MIRHQGHIFNIGSKLTEMWCMRVKYDPRGTHPVGSKVLVDKEMYRFIKAGKLVRDHNPELSMLSLHGIGDSDRSRYEVDTHGLFPARHNSGIFNKGRIDISNLTQIDGRRLFNLHYIKPIDKFNMDVIGYVVRYVKRWGAISLKFGNHGAAKDFMSHLRTITNMYTYQGVFGNNFMHTGSDFFKHDTCRFYASFLDISYCIPIWNTKRVNGMGMIVSLLSDSDNGGSNPTPLTAFTSAFIMSNYEDNVFRVDGCQANPREGVGDDLLGTLLDMTGSAKKYEDYHKGKAGKTKAKAKVKKSSAKMSEYRQYKGYTYSGNDASTTSTSYYTTTS